MQHQRTEKHVICIMEWNANEHRIALLLNSTVTTVHSGDMRSHHTPQAHIIQNESILCHSVITKYIFICGMHVVLQPLPTHRYSRWIHGRSMAITIQKSSPLPPNVIIVRRNDKRCIPYASVLNSRSSITDHLSVHLPKTSHFMSYTIQCTLPRSGSPSKPSQTRIAFQAIFGFFHSVNFTFHSHSIA